MMPRYYFNIEGDPCGPDLDGHDLADVDAAKSEAAKMVGAMICDLATNFWDAGELTVNVTDKAGSGLFTLTVVGHEAAALAQPTLRHRRAKSSAYALWRESLSGM